MKIHSPTIKLLIKRAEDKRKKMDEPYGSLGPPFSQRNKENTEHVIEYLKGVLDTCTMGSLSDK